MYISDIIADSVAARDGRLRQGDQILQVNAVNFLAVRSILLNIFAVFMCVICCCFWRIFLLKEEESLTHTMSIETFDRINQLQAFFGYKSLS